MSSIKKNFIYSGALTIANYLFPLMVFPYISRVLGVSNVGACNFVDSIINYYILISMMGVTTLGIREIAHAKDDLLKVKNTFTSLIVLNAIATCIALVVLVISIFTVPKLYENRELMFIGVIKLISNFLLIEWFYTGLEKFKYITNRSIIIKFLYVLSVFFFVRKPEDYIIYFFLTTIMVMINAICNCWFARKYFLFKFYDLSLKVVLKPFLILGVYGLLTSMYLSFNVIFLGFKTDDIEVGYYVTATKIYAILIALYTAFTNVMMPRLSYLLADNKIEEFKRMIVKSQELLFMFTIPICIITIIFAGDIINIVAGKGYEGAILPMKIIMPLLVIVGYEQILVLQILTPLKKDREIFINSFFGAIIGVVLNILLVPLYKSIGSSIVWVVSECVVLISSQFFVLKYIKIKFPIKKLTINVLYFLPAILGFFYLNKIIKFSAIINLFIAGVFMFIYFYIVQNYFLKNEMFISMKNKIYEKFQIFIKSY